MKFRLISAGIMLLLGSAAIAQVPDVLNETVTNEKKDSVISAPVKRDSGTYIPRMKRSSWYLELGGNGLGASVNLERSFPAKDKNVWVARAGVGYFYKADTSYIIVPLTFGKVYKKKKYLLEVAVGLAPYRATPGEMDFYLTGVLAYRRSIQEKYYFKAAFTPYIAFSKAPKGIFINYDVNPFVGIGIGRYF